MKTAEIIKFEQYRLVSIGCYTGNGFSGYW